MSTPVNDIPAAVRILRSGGLVAFPTETVYGLGADATNAAAVEKIFRVKGRPATNPLIVHVADQNIARRYAAEWPAAAERLAERFWPGPLTLVVRKREMIVPNATAGLETVGLRSPDHPLALEMLRQFDGPVAAPSANRSTRVSPTTAQHVRDELGDAVDYILDGGPCSVGIESTVLDLTSPVPVILRPGAITAEQIAAEIGPVSDFKGAVRSDLAAVSPGQQAIHYAPRAPAYHVSRHNLDAAMRFCRPPAGELVAFVSLGPTPAALNRIRFAHTIEMPASPEEYARSLYAVLRDLDLINPSAILIEMPPDEPQWAAVRDRLSRATRRLP
jgi:L-threonylcarbamoyladenylate synthase